MTFFKRLLLTLCIILPVCCLHTGSFAQDILNKTVTLDVKKKPLRDVLVMIGKQRGFYFSYSSNSIPKDSLVSISVVNKPVKVVLGMLLGENCQYKETDNHIIIQPAEREKWFTISGYLVDGITGAKVAEASVFEEQQLVSTLSDENGYFKLRLKDREKYVAARIRVSKGFYRDTVVATGQGYDQELLIPFNPADYDLPGVEITEYSSVEKSWFGRHLFSSKLRKQSANLTKFFVDKPVQFSLVPGLGTHGKLSGQVTNKFSFNVLGGYTAGVDGFELGGLFNINKKDAKYVQIGGISNVVSGNAEGLQIGGVVNNVSGSVNGVQISGVISHIRGNARGLVLTGISSHVGGNMRGMQISGIANTVRNRDTTGHRDTAATDSVRGMQIAGIANYSVANTEGMQLAGIANICRGDVNGVQMSGIINRARRVSGMQIGFINIADTVDGYALGFLNIVKHGYHKLSVYSNETFTINAAYKAGNHKLYSVLAFGYNGIEGKKAYSYAYGLGNEILFNKRLSMCSEFTYNQLFVGDTSNTPNILRLQSSLNFIAAKKLSFYAGPSVVLCTAMQRSRNEGYFSGIPTEVFKGHQINPRTAVWIGWQVGVSIF